MACAAFLQVGYLELLQIIKACRRWCRQQALSVSHCNNLHSSYILSIIGTLAMDVYRERK